MTTVPDVADRPRPAGSCAARSRRPASGAGSPPSTTRRSGSSTAGTALVFFVVAGIEALLIRLQLAGPNGTRAHRVAVQHAVHDARHDDGVPRRHAAGRSRSATTSSRCRSARATSRSRASTCSATGSFAASAACSSTRASSSAARRTAAGSATRRSPARRSPAVPARATAPTSGPSASSCSASGRRRPAINFIVTILNMRAPGMTLMRMPVFVWMMLVVAFLTVFAMPVVTAALIMVFFDRNFGTNFFLAVERRRSAALPAPVLAVRPSRGVHPDPARAWASSPRSCPVFSRKPLFGYSVVVFSGIAIGFLGWGVWAHHMFATGLGPVAISAFGLSTMLIAIPTGVKIFNWLGTVWGGSVRLNDADAVLARLHRDVHHRRSLRRHCTRSSRPTRSRPTPTSSSRTSTTCCSAA